MSERHILIIDDEADIREVAAVGLEAFGGFVVSEAGSGREGVERAAEQGPDAILLDVMMPEMDGPTTLGRLRARCDTRDIPVIFLTAKVQASERDTYRRLGAAAVLAKPFDPVELPSQVSRALGWD